MWQRTGERRMFIYSADPVFLRRAEVQHTDTDQSVEDVRGEMESHVGVTSSVHAAAAVSALHESTVTHRTGLYQAFADTLVTILLLCLSFFIFDYLYLTFDLLALPLHLCLPWLSLLYSIFMHLLSTLHLTFQYLRCISKSTFLSCCFVLSFLSSADPVHTNFQSGAERLRSRTTASKAP